jgi:3-oxoadipate enol-lactonase
MPAAATTATARTQCCGTWGGTFGLCWWTTGEADAATFRPARSASLIWPTTSSPVLDRAGIRRAHVMGVSLGGMVAQELAVDHPERVSDLILVSTTPGWPFAYPMPAASAALIARTGSLTREVAARCHAENALSARTVLERPEVADRLVALHSTRPAEPRALAAQATAGAGYSGRLRQTRIRARTLVLHGSADTVVDPGNSKLLADRIPGAQLVIFPELGHLLFWEEPDRFVDAVTLFLLAERAPRKVLHVGDGKH